MPISWYDFTYHLTLFFIYEQLLQMIVTVGGRWKGVRFYPPTLAYTGYFNWNRRKEKCLCRVNIMTSYELSTNLKLTKCTNCIGSIISNTVHILRGAYNGLASVRTLTLVRHCCFMDRIHKNIKSPAIMRCVVVSLLFFVFIALFFVRGVDCTARHCVWAL